MPEVTIYTRTTCGPCRTVKYLLNKMNIDYNEKNIDENQEHVEDLLKLTGFQIVPVVIINGETVLGGNIPKINQLLTQACSVC